jgi:hypothetical protein
MEQQRPTDDQPAADDAPVGGDETTEDELDADNAVEEDMLETLKPESSTS